MTELTLALSAAHHKILSTHLFPGDGLEAAAILICGRAGINGTRLCVSSIITILYDACQVRTSTRLTWPGNYLDSAIDAADEIGGTILLTHSHPGGYHGFSQLDDDSDMQTIPSLKYGSREESIPHGSAIMVPNGAMKVRLYNDVMQAREVSHIQCIGPDIIDLSETNKPTILPFTTDMTNSLALRSACVVGASGTGSPVIEIITRMGIGKLVQIDFDHIEQKNLNRIINSTIKDVTDKRLKTDMLEAAAKRHRPDIKIISVADAISSEQSIKVASECDVIFCCVDTMEGRLICDLISEACVMPLIDMGVMIPTRSLNNTIEIADVCGRIDYIYPGGATLRDKGEVTGEGLAAEDLRRTDPQSYAKQLSEGYIKGVTEEAPSVIALNMHIASAAVLDWIARLFPFRHQPNAAHDRIFISLASNEYDYESSPPVARANNRSILGHGLSYPLLGLSANVPRRKDAA